MTSATRRRGHQHHPRHATRRRLDASSRGPAQCGTAGKSSYFATNDETSTPTKITTATSYECHKTNNNNNLNASIRFSVEGDESLDESKKNDSIANEITTKLNVEESTDCPKSVQPRPALCGLTKETEIVENESSKRLDSFNDFEDANGEIVSPRTAVLGARESTRSRTDDNGSPVPEHAVARARGDGNSDDETPNVEEDPELAELAKLRCPSERTEVQAEREARRRKRCADYPGLAFGSSIFSSDTMMKFSLIRNELKNIMGNQLKRVSIECWFCFIRVFTNDYWRDT